MFIKNYVSNIVFKMESELNIIIEGDGKNNAEVEEDDDEEEEEEEDDDEDDEE